MNEEIDRLHDSAQDFLDAGQLQGAVDIYKKILKMNPKDHDAWLMLGAIHGELGSVGEAVECCRSALEISPADTETRLVLGRLLLHQGKLKEAAGCLQVAAREDSQQVEVWQLLAGIYGELQDYRAAERCAEEVVRLSPGNAAGYVLLGQARGESGDYPGAFEVCRHALKLEPLNIAVHMLLGWLYEKTAEWREARGVYEEVLSRDAGNVAAQAGAGRALLMLGDTVAAETAYKKLLQSHGGNAEAFDGLGRVAMKNRQPEDAERHYRQALQLAPELGTAWVGLGNALQDQGKYALAAPCYEKSLEINSQDADAYYNQGVMEMRLGHLDKAETKFCSAIKYSPDFVQAHWDRAFVLLMQGDYERGWLEYEWRLQQAENIRRPFLQPVWDGSSLAGRTILVHDEQGFGDTFQFIRYLPLLKEKGAKVILECNSKLGKILKGCSGCDQLVERESPEHIPAVDFDVHIQLMSLPMVFGTTLGSIPDRLPYLHPDPDGVSDWKERFADDRKFKVGIAWAGSSMHTNEQSRSCLLDDFAILGDIPGVSFYSLQKGHGMEQAGNPPGNLNLINLGKELDQAGAFVDTAAVMACMDLVITIDTSIAHLAGGLGCPVWVLLCSTPDWRWMQDREDTPWYPGMKLFRQAEAGQWSSVFHLVSEKLREFSTAKQDLSHVSTN